MAKKTTPTARVRSTNQPVNNTPRNQTASEYIPAVSDTFGSIRRYHLIPSLIISLLAIVLYSRSVTYDYVLDDQIVIHNNTYTKQGISAWGKILTTESFQGYFGKTQKLVEGGRYRPLSLMTFAAEWQAFAPDTTKLPLLYDNSRNYNDAKTLPVRFIHHLMNILLYCLSGLLLYRVMWLLFPNSLHGSWYRTIPFVATALWITHPTHVEAVANIKGRDEILSLLGALGSLFFVFRYLATGQFKWLILSALSFFLGLLSKENTITFLAVIPLSMYFFTQARRSQYIATFVPLAIATLIYMMMRISSVGFLTVGKEITDLMNNPFAEMTFGQKYATIFYTLLQYLKLSFFPHPLTHDYYPYHIPITNWTDLRAIGSLAVYTGLAAIAVWGWKKKRVESFAVLFFIATLSIVSNIVFPVGTFMNERFIYFSTIGVCLWLAWLLMEQLPSRKPALRGVAMGIATLVLLGFCFKTWTRVPAWETGETLNRTAIAVSKNSARANLFFGTALFQQNFQEKLRTRDSVYAALNLTPDALIQRRSQDTLAAFRALDTASFYINRALEIHSDYNSALTMKAGVAAEFHKRDKDTPKLLKAFLEICQQGRYVDFMSAYTKWMHGRYETDLLLNYYEQAYQALMQKQRPEFAKSVLDLAKLLQPNSPFVLANSK